MKKYHLSFDIEDVRDFVYEHILKAFQLPESVDLRSKFLAKPYDQLELGSCTANSLVGLREYLLTQNKNPYVHLSRLFIYYYERYLEGTVNEDSGASLRDGMKVLQKMGVCPEEDFEYHVADFADKPSNKAIANALNYRIKEYHRVLTLNGLKHALADGLPVTIGFRVFKSLESPEVAKTGMINFPKKGEEELGGHAVLVVGYKTINNKPYYIIRNSWGTSWGDGGYGYMPEEFFTEGLVVDMWIGHL